MTQLHCDKEFREGPDIMERYTSKLEIMQLKQRLTYE